MDAATTAAVAAEAHASGYRLKFDREEFLQLVDIAKPRIIYGEARTTYSPTTASSCIARSAATRT